MESFIFSAEARAIYLAPIIIFKSKLLKKYHILGLTLCLNIIK